MAHCTLLGTLGGGLRASRAPCSQEAQQSDRPPGARGPSAASRPFTPFPFDQLRLIPQGPQSQPSQALQLLPRTVHFMGQGHGIHFTAPADTFWCDTWCVCH